MMCGSTLILSLAREVKLVLSANIASKLISWRAMKYCQSGGDEI